jgi:hypothetical protein
MHLHKNAPITSYTKKPAIFGESPNLACIFGITF